MTFENFRADDLQMCWPLSFLLVLSLYDLLEMAPGPQRSSGKPATGPETIKPDEEHCHMYLALPTGALSGDLFT